MKRFLVQLAAAFIVYGFALPGLASEPKVIGWNDLAPEPVTYENPFEGLSPEQLTSLRKLLRYQQNENSDGNGITPEEVVVLRAKLEEDGLNIEWLFEQRKIIMETRQKLMTETNKDILGQSVRIPGYLLPLEMKDQKAIQFLLVPTVGACIHTPTPPANQMVYVHYPEGFSIKELYTPIWVSGKILADNRVEMVRYVDGERRVPLSYSMKGDIVKPY